MAFVTVRSKNLIKTFQTVPSTIDKNAPFCIIMNRLFDDRCRFWFIELFRVCNVLHTIRDY